jgi:hypothetical protein
MADGLVRRCHERMHQQTRSPEGASDLALYESYLHVLRER